MSSEPEGQDQITLEPNQAFTSEDAGPPPLEPVTVGEKSPGTGDDGHLEEVSDRVMMPLALSLSLSLLFSSLSIQVSSAVMELVERLVTDNNIMSVYCGY